MTATGILPSSLSAPSTLNAPLQASLIIDRFARRESLTAKSGNVVAKILTEARARLAGHKRRHSDLTPLLDASILIIEDEHGVLWHNEGDLSFLMDSTPVIWKKFSNQLNADCQKDYGYAQQAVWDYEIRGNAQFVTACGRQAAIFPLFVSGVRFTATVFYFGTGPDIL